MCSAPAASDSSRLLTPGAAPAPWSIVGPGAGQSLTLSCYSGKSFWRHTTHPGHRWNSFNLCRLKVSLTWKCYFDKLSFRNHIFIYSISIFLKKDLSGRSSSYQSRRAHKMAKYGGSFHFRLKFVQQAILRYSWLLSFLIPLYSVALGQRDSPIWNNVLGRFWKQTKKCN